MRAALLTLTVLLAMLLTGCTSGSVGSAPTPDVGPSTPTTVSTAGAVAWTDAAFTHYQRPPRQRPAPRPSDAPPCTVGELHARLNPNGDGASDHEVTYVDFRNTGSTTCVLKGYPRLTATSPGRPDVAAVDGDTYLPYPGTTNMAPGRTTQLAVVTGVYCSDGGDQTGPTYHHLDITLPTGGELHVGRPGADFGLTCGLHISTFFVEPHRPKLTPDPLSRLHVRLQLPTEVSAGSTLVYLADLTNPTDYPISLDRCPGYLEVAPGSTPRSAALIKTGYELDCGPVGAIPAHHTVRFVMHLPIAPTVPAGRLTLRWSLLGPYPAPAAHATVTVTAPGG